MNKIQKLVDVSYMRGLRTNLKGYKRSKLHKEVKRELKRIFDNALKGIKPIKEPKNLFENLKSISNYKKINFKNYLKQVDNRMFQLKKNLEKEKINISFEFNVTFKEFWIDFQINMEDIEAPDPWTCDLAVYDFFDKVLFKNIYQKLNIYPFMIELCKNIIVENDDLKVYTLNWDTWREEKIVDWIITKENEKYKLEQNKKPDLSKPPCQECGTTTPEETETMCICSGDKDNCHECYLLFDRNCIINN